MGSGWGCRAAAFLQRNCAGEDATMATAAEPAACSQGPRPEKGKPKASRSRSASQGRRWWGRRPRALRPGPTDTGDRSQDIRQPGRRLQTQRAEATRREGSDPEATGQRRHFVTAGKAVTGPQGRCGRAWCGIRTSLSHPSRRARPHPARPTCVAHGGGQHNIRRRRLLLL